MSEHLGRHLFAMQTLHNNGHRLLLSQQIFVRLRDHGVGLCAAISLVAQY